MFISAITISNFRLFSQSPTFAISEFNVPNGEDEGSGINVFVGENGCGKTTLLDALGLPLLEYKSDSFALNDFNDPKEPVLITLSSKAPFTVKGTMPNASFEAHGFCFKAGLRSRATRSYLSSIVVTDQLFLRYGDKPADGSPDLRVSVNNPFSGKRFSENDVVFLDRNRFYQIRSGSFNSTRFDRLMEDFNYQYIKGSDSVADLYHTISEEIKKVKVANSHINDAIGEFADITGIQVNLDFMDNYHPFRNASFVHRKENSQHIQLDALGSGYEMIFSLVFAYHMARQSGKQLIVLIDEPELHMHPALQEKLIAFMLKISKETQIFMSTHSALLIKQLAQHDNARIIILRGNRLPSLIEERKLPYISANETNYLAFGLSTEEYHNELYEHLKELHGDSLSLKGFDNSFFIQEKREAKGYPCWGHPNEVSLHTFVRNQIHHAAENGSPSQDDLKASILLMRSYIN